MSLSSELQETLREFSASGPAELRENGTRVAALSLLSWEVRGNPEKPLLHLWSQQLNLTRRVLAITGHSEQRLSLAVECFGRSKPDRLEFLRTDTERSPAKVSREAFAQAIRTLCENAFPDETLDSLSCEADLEHSLSGNYVRGALRRGRALWALLAVPESHEARDPARCLTFALLWLDRLAQRAGRSAPAGIRLVVPPGAAEALVHLLPALRADLRVEVFERDPVLETLRKIEPPEAANFSSRLVAARETEALVARAREQLDSLLAHFDGAISFHANEGAKEVIVRYRGLSFLRWHESGISFGPGHPQKRLELAKKNSVQELFRQLETHRHPLAANRRHPMYRMQAERWLEFLVREDVARIDPALDSRFAYSQVAASTGAEHGILDVLSVTRNGRLAILELKAEEDPVFLLQAARYWLRIRLHLEQGDFPRYGYFPGIPLQTKLPLIYLVAPALRFHPATSVLLRYLDPQIEVVRVGLSESWRRGLCVVLRQ